MIDPDIQGVARTLLPPLACRARESVRPDAMLHDSQAVELFKHFADTDCLMDMSALDQTFTAMRARQFDRYACAFLEVHPAGLVVDIGCGLDTRFFRLDNGQMAWLGVDLPEVISFRRQFLPDADRCQTLPCSLFDLAWVEEVARIGRPTIFLAEGVFVYFKESEVKPVVVALARYFPGSELAFDALSTLSIKMHNRTSVPQQTGAHLNWGIDDPAALEAWGLCLLDRWGYFDDREPRVGLANLMRFIPFLANANFILHYRLNG